MRKSEVVAGETYLWKSRPVVALESNKSKVFVRIPGVHGAELVSVRSLKPVPEYEITEWEPEAPAPTCILRIESECWHPVVEDFRREVLRDAIDSLLAHAA